MKSQEDILTRRAFFKKTIQRTLPILMGATVLSSLISCVKEDSDLLHALDDEGGSNSGNGNGKDEISGASGTVDGYEYVDLGLSVKWATCNYGASYPYEYGKWLEFVAGASGENSTELRARMLRAGYRSGDSIAGSSFDSITQKCGNKWRTPTKQEWEELINNSVIKRYEYHKIIGLQFISKKNGNSIYLPGAGCRGEGREFSPSYYWTSVFSYIEAAGANAYSVEWTIGTGDNYFLRVYKRDIEEMAMSVRAVTDGTASPSSCNNGCTANCANNSTNSGCSNCASNCSEGCKTKCDYNCAATCVNHCYGRCNDTCGGGCTYLSAGTGCSGCATTCSLRCYHQCTWACSSNCQSSCVNGTK